MSTNFYQQEYMNHVYTSGEISETEMPRHTHSGGYYRQELNAVQYHDRQRDYEDELLSDLYRRLRGIRLSSRAVRELHHIIDMCYHEEEAEREMIYRESMMYAESIKRMRFENPYGEIKESQIQRKDFLEEEEMVL